VTRRKASTKPSNEKDHNTPVTQQSLSDIYDWRTNAVNICSKMSKSKHAIFGNDLQITFKTIRQSQ